MQFRKSVLGLALLCLLAGAVVAEVSQAEEDTPFCAAERKACEKGCVDGSFKFDCHEALGSVAVSCSCVSESGGTSSSSTSSSSSSSATTITSSDS